MKLYYECKDYKLYEGNMLDMLEAIDKESVDSIITDPPYELNFMGKGWDNAGVSFQPDTWKKCFEVLKPGGYLLAFGGSRTFHRIACAIEDAGFEIRDTIMWLYGSGFPKSMSLSKGLEAREKLGNAGTRNKRKIEQSCDSESYILRQTNNGAMGEIIETTRKQYIPNTNLAKQWQGWGTCLKPSFEPIIVARKPFKGSLVDNVIAYGVGGINIDECRVETNDKVKMNIRDTSSCSDGWNRPWMEDKEKDKLRQEIAIEKANNLGRFPANTILTYDETDFDEVCGGFPNTKSNGGKTTMSDFSKYKGSMMNITNLKEQSARKESNYIAPCDSGSASRYFYCAKASKKDRDDGLDEFEDIDGGTYQFRQDGSLVGKIPIRKNTHPTVKPTELMQYLVRLVNPNGATILDPFNGSGSTGKAVMYENKERDKNYKYIGIEITDEYLPISKSRIDYARGGDFGDNHIGDDN